MRVCCICASEISTVSPENDGYCYFCKKEVSTVETTNLIAEVIENQIYYFEVLDLLTQFNLILDSIGSHEEKLDKLKICIENEYWRLCKDE